MSEKKKYVITVDISAKMPYDFLGVSPEQYFKVLGERLQRGVEKELEYLRDDEVFYLDGVEFGYVPVCDDVNEFVFNVVLE